MNKKIPSIIESLKRYNPEKIILFGSAVRGEVDKYSDLDLVVIKQTSKIFIQRLVEVGKMLSPALGNIDVFVYTPREFKEMQRSGNPFIEKVLEEGKVIYEKC
jgi:predicted nucleotidyltransferase